MLKVLSKLIGFFFQWAAEPTAVTTFNDADDWSAPTNDWSATAATIPAAVGATTAQIAAPPPPTNDWGAEASWPH